MAIKTYEEVFASNTPSKKSGIKTYEDIFGAQPQVQPKEVKKPSLNETTTPWLEKHPTLKKNIFDPLGKLARAYEETGAGKFHTRASETALDVMSAQEMKPDRTSTDSKVADTIATGLGLVGGLAMSPGKGMPSLGSGLLKTEQAGRFLGTKLATLAPKLNPLAQKILPTATGGALAGGLGDAGYSVARGDDAKTVAKNALIGMTLGAILDPTIEHAILPAGSRAFTKAEEAILPFAKKAWAKIRGKTVADTVKGVAKTVDPDEIAREVARDIGVDWDRMNETQKAAIRKVVLSAQGEAVQSGRLLDAGQNFTFRDVKPSDYPGSIVKPAGKARVVNKALEKANEELKEATEYLQNYFRTNELRVNEMEFAKKTLGVDLEKLADKVLEAEQSGLPDFTRAAERGRMARVAGIKLPKPVRGITPKPAISEMPTPVSFKQTIEVPKVYDKDAFIGQTKTRRQIMDELATTPLSTAADDTVKLAAATVDNAATVRSAPQSTKPRPEPDIPAGLKERGVSKNIRTDSNRPDAIRDSLSADPLVYEQLANKETLQKAQDIMAQGVEKARSELDILIRDMKPESAPLAKMIADEYVRLGNVDAAREVLSNAAVKATQAGQLGQAFRILRDSADPAAVLSTVDKLLKDLNTKGLARFGDKWINIDLTSAEKTMIQNLPKGDEAAFNNALEQIGDRIAKSGIIPTTSMEKFDAWRRIAMLFNPKTHVRNIGGNVIMMGMRKSADTVASGIEAAVNAFRKSKGLAPIQRTKAVGWSKNKAIVDATEKVWEANKKDLLQVGRWDIENFRFLNREKRIFDTGWLENLSELSKQGLNAGDAPFVKRAYKDALGQFMTAQNLTTATDEAMEYAKRRAFEATFKQANELSKIIQGLKSKGGVAGTLVEGAIPFVRTPANILMRGLEYSPAGLMKTLFSKGKAPTEIIEGLAKGMTGTGIAALGFLLADMGWAKYERSKSKNVEAILQQMGEQANSIITPQGSYTFDWAQPFAIPLAMGIAAHEALEKNNESALEAAKEAILAGGDTLFAQGMLRNIRDIMGGAYGSTTEAILSVPVSYVEQAFPTVFGQVARAVDPIRRSTYDTSDIGTFARGIGAKLPFASKKLEPRLDVFGREQKQDSVLNQFLNPGYWKAKSDDPVTKEIVRLYRATGDTSILPKVAPTAGFSRNKIKYKFTPQQLTQFQRETGERNYTEIKRWLAANPRATDDQKTAALKKIVSKTDDLIKDKFAKEFKMPPLK
jgi:hypothetical protein